MRKKMGIDKNWFTKDAWLEIRQAFESLPANSQANYKSLAESTNDLANKSKKVESARSIFANSQLSLTARDTESERAMVASAGTGQPLNMLLASLDFKLLRDNMKSLDLLLSHLLKQQHKRGGYVGEVNNVWPVDASPVLSALMGMRCARRSMLDVTKGFQKLGFPKPSAWLNEHHESTCSLGFQQ